MAPCRRSFGRRPPCVLKAGTLRPPYALHGLGCPFEWVTMAGRACVVSLARPPWWTRQKEKRAFAEEETCTLCGFLRCDSHTAARLRARGSLRRSSLPQPEVRSCEGGGRNAPSLAPLPLRSRRAKIRFSTGASPGSAS